MTRKEYRTQLFKNDALVLEAINFAWNAAHRSIPKRIKEVSNRGECWELIDKYYAKDENKQYIDCVQHWENPNGDLIRVGLELI